MYIYMYRYEVYLIEIHACNVPSKKLDANPTDPYDYSLSFELSFSRMPK